VLHRAFRENRFLIVILHNNGLRHGAPSSVMKKSVNCNLSYDGIHFKFHFFRPIPFLEYKA
jgi:hypothetical protein